MQLHRVLITFSGCPWHLDQAEAFASVVVVEVVLAVVVLATATTVTAVDFVVEAEVPDFVATVVAVDTVVRAARLLFFLLSPLTHLGGKTAEQKACAIGYG